MTKHLIKPVIKPFVYEDFKGVHSIYKTTHYKCPVDTIDVLQWGNIQWTSMSDMFEHCEYIYNFSATDKPDLSRCISMSNMFRNAKLFNGDISDWDVSNVRFVCGMFFRAKRFKQDLSNWDLIYVRNPYNFAHIQDPFEDCPIPDEHKPKFN